MRYSFHLNVRTSTFSFQATPVRFCGFLDDKIKPMIVILATGEFTKKPRCLLGSRPILTRLYNTLTANYPKESIGIITDSSTYRHIVQWSLIVNPIPKIYFLPNVYHTDSVLDALAIVTRNSQRITRLVTSDCIPLSFLNETWTDDESDFVYLTTSKQQPLLAFDISEFGIDTLKPWLLTGNYVKSTNNNTQMDILISYVQKHLDYNKFSLGQGDVLEEWLLDNSTEQFEDKWSSLLHSNSQSQINLDRKPIISKVYARIGFIGNPSDGFYGKTISTLISNFYAVVTLTPNMEKMNPKIIIHPNPLFDIMEFSSFDTSPSTIVSNGYYGAVRLFLAVTKVLSNYCKEHQLKTNSTGFEIEYNTTVPRQVGLAGSSALVTALMKALIKYHELDIPLPVQANLALSCEVDELGIAAGHQDRVVQAFGGMVYMDFDRSLMTSRGYGDYQSIDVQLLPNGLWMAFILEPKESGKVHHNIKQRFQAGDQTVIDAMKQFANITTQCYQALINKEEKLLSKLINQNFECRRALYGDAVIGAPTLKMIEIARSHGHVAKLTGSGGCIFGMWNGENEADEDVKAKSIIELQSHFESEGYVFTKLNFDF
ncbi:hypothetical protein HDV02_001313 [Globomyces sp. JEL0801]|nr:hypothetical protein HDV02_001313 [Globomyces sp. JEL0801]